MSGILVSLVWILYLPYLLWWVLKYIVSSGATRKPIEHFLNNIELCLETGHAVLSAFLERHILPHYNNSLKNFIESVRHEIFHKQNPKVTCCKCDSKRSSTKVKPVLHQFEYFFSLDATKKKIRHSSNDFKICLCSYYVKLSKCAELDLSSLALVATSSVYLEKYQKDWISNLLNQRHNLCHVPRVSSLSK